MRRILRAAAAYFLSAFIAAGMFVQAAAASENGIGVSAGELSAGDTFTLTITVPSAENADTASVQAAFDPDVFEVISWEPEVTGSVHNSGEGFLILTAANAERAVELEDGLVLEALMSVKSTAASGSYEIKLTKHSFSYVLDNGYEYKELWEPSDTTVTVSVAGAVTDSGTADMTEEPTVVIDTEEQTNGDYVTEEPVVTQSGAAENTTVTANIKPVNPYTGVTEMITVPVAAAGCVLLARKIVKRRKRTVKYIDDNDINE